MIEEQVLVDALRKMLEDRPHCRGLDARALSLILQFRGYLGFAPDDRDVEEALEVLKLEDDPAA